MAVTSAGGASTPGERVLEFPADPWGRAIGTIQLRPLGVKFDTRWDEVLKDWGDKIEARGAVQVPAGREAMLTINLATVGDLKCLRNLPPGIVTSLKLSNGKLSDEGWENVLQLPAFPRLTFTAVELNEAVLGRLDRLAGLRRIDAIEVKFGNALAAAAANLPTLESFHIYGGGLTDAGMVHIGKMIGLKDLGLARDDITDTGFARLAPLTQLEEMNCWSLPAVGDVGAAALAGMAKLRKLTLMQTGIGDGGAAYMVNLKELRQLRLDQTKVTDAGISHLASLPCLEELTFPQGIGDAGLLQIGKIQSLRKLHCSHGTATDTGLAALTGLTHLELFDISGDKITDAGAAEIAKLTTLKSIGLQNCAVGDEGFAKIAANRNLESVNLNNTRITDASLALLPHLPRLVSLSLSAPRGTKVRLQSLAGCTGMTTLSINGDLADDNELAHLRGMSQLERIFGIPSFGDAGAEHIAALPNLKFLYAYAAKVTDAGLAKLAFLIKLEKLQIGGEITDEGLMVLASLRNLQYLHLNTRSTTIEARETLRAKLPSLTTITVPPGPPPSAKPKVGDIAPPIDAVAIDGKKWSLADQRGKVVLAYFWATWCSPCVVSQPAMRDHFAELHKNERFAMVSLSQDYQEFTLRRFVEKTPLPWPQLFIGMDSPIAAAWGTAGLAPHYFLVGPDGKILSTTDDWNELTSTSLAVLKAPATQPAATSG